MKEIGRCDAEYFQPKYIDILNAIKKYTNGFDTLNNSIKLRDSNFNPKEKETYKYIELSNIGSNGDILGCTKAKGSELPSRARRKIKFNDLIVSSIEGSLDKIALVSEEYDNSLCSTGFYVLHSETINSETLLIFLKSLSGNLQLKKGCSGTILTAISKDELNRILIPKFNNKLQEQIKLKVIEAYGLREKSKALLEIAKKGVEMAIEKDENTAEKWISSELKKLGVETNA